MCSFVASDGSERLAAASLSCGGRGGTRITARSGTEPEAGPSAKTEPAAPHRAALLGWRQGTADCADRDGGCQQQSLRIRTSARGIESDDDTACSLMTFLLMVYNHGANVTTGGSATHCVTQVAAFGTPGRHLSQSQPIPSNHSLAPSGPCRPAACRPTPAPPHHSSTKARASCRATRLAPQPCPHLLMRRLQHCIPLASRNQPAHGCVRETSRLPSQRHGHTTGQPTRRPPSQPGLHPTCRPLRWRSCSGIDSGCWRGGGRARARRCAASRGACEDTGRARAAPAQGAKRVWLQSAGSPRYAQRPTQQSRAPCPPPSISAGRTPHQQKRGGRRSPRRAPPL